MNAALKDPIFASPSPTNPFGRYKTVDGISLQTDDQRLLFQTLNRLYHFHALEGKVSQNSTLSDPANRRNAEADARKLALELLEKSGVPRWVKPSVIKDLKTPKKSFARSKPLKFRELSPEAKEYIAERNAFQTTASTSLRENGLSSPRIPPRVIRGSHPLRFNSTSQEAAAYINERNSRDHVVTPQISRSMALVPIAPKFADAYFVDAPKGGIARKVLNWSWKNAPELVVGGLAGAGLKVTAQFALAAMATTIPGFVAAVAAAPVLSAIVSTAAVGALAGGFTKIATTKLFHAEKTLENGWWWNAFKQGAKAGVIGGEIGLGIASHFHFGVLSQHAVAAKSAVAHGASNHASHTVVTAPHAALSHSSAPVHPTDVTPVSASGSVKNLLTDEQLKSLPSQVQKLAESEKATDVIKFCKEASAQLIKSGHHTKEAYQAGVRLVERGLDVAQKANLHGHVVNQLQADETYLKAWGLGTTKSVTDAAQHARLSGTAVHHYGLRFVNFFKPANG